MQARIALMAAGWFSVTALGCGGQSDFPEIAPVTGTVTLDGQPLANAIVTFQPVEAGRPSYARTDENGRYEMIYTNDNPGARLGKHRVMITTGSSGDDEGQQGTAEKVPSRYNITTELEAVVDAGENEFDWPLESGGEIVQDEEEGRRARGESNSC